MLAVGFTFLAALAFGRYNLLFVSSGVGCIQHASGDLNCFWENLGNIRSWNFGVSELAPDAGGFCSKACGV